MPVREIDLEALLAAHSAGDGAQVEARGHELGVALSLETLAALEELAIHLVMLEDVLAVVSQATESPLGIGLRELSDAHAHGLPGRDFVLAVRTDAAVVVGSAHAARASTRVGGVWPELMPWHRDMAKNRARALRWAEADDPERVVLPLSRRGARRAPDPGREASLTRAIVSDPDDDDKRLVLADWLLENGDARGELIRTQCELAAAGQRHPHYRELLRRETALWEQYGEQLAGDVPRFCREYQLRRGFVETVLMSVASFEKHGRRLFAEQPIVTLHVKPASDAELERLAAAPALGQVRALSLVDPRRSPLRLAALADSRHLANLRGLDLSGRIASPDDWETLLSRLEAPELRWVELGGARMSAAALVALAHNRSVAALTRLGFADVRVAPEAARATEAARYREAFVALGHSRALERLGQVDASMAWGAPTTSDLALWLRGPNAARLEVLRLADARLDDLERPEALHAGMPRLRRLDLGDASITTGGLERLLASLPSLEELRWEFARGLGVVAVLSLPRSHQLRRLLIDNVLPPEVSEALGRRFELVPYRRGPWWLEPNVHYQPRTTRGAQR